MSRSAVASSSDGVDSSSASDRAVSGHCRPRPRARCRGARAPLRGAASYEADRVMRCAGRRVHGRGDAPLSGLVPPAPAAPDYSDADWSPIVEQFLLVNNVVAVEDGAASLCSGQVAWRPALETFARHHRLRAAVRRQVVKDQRVSHPVPTDRRCATPCANGGRGCRRGGRRAGCWGRGVPAIHDRQKPRRWVVRSGESAPPASSS